MSHSGILETQDVLNDIRDIRGIQIRGADDTNLGRVKDVIVDHDTMTIQYLVVESDGWSESGTFLLPADRVSADEDNDEGLAAAVDRQQVENSPQYDKTTLQSTDDWKDFEQDFKQYWEEEPIMHMKNSDRIITPPEEPASEEAESDRQDEKGAVESDERPLNVSSLFPNRLTNVFTDPAPKSSKVTLAPKPEWWEAFENYLRINKDKIRSNCSQCSSKAA